MAVGLVAVALAVTAAVALPSATFAQTGTTTETTPPADTTAPDSARPARGIRGDADAHGPVAGIRPGQGGNQAQYLADALGITLAELQTAEQNAETAAIDEAVSKGLITQAQADALKAGTQRSGLRGLLKGSEAQIDTAALLAQALNITTDELQAAQVKAQEAELAAAVADGRMTQAQADLMKAQQALKTYMEENDVYQQIVGQAVSAGALTQAQADALLAAQESHGGFDARGFGDFGGGPRGGRGGH